MSVKVGDKIRVTDKVGYTSDMYKEGDVLTVKSVGSDRVHVEEFGAPFIYDYEFEVVEAAPKPEEGDIIVFESEEMYVTVGKPYVIQFVDGVGDVFITDDDGDDYILDPEEEDFALFKRVGPKPEPKPVYRPEVGDIVKLTSDSPLHGFGYVKTGDIGTVVDTESERSVIEFPRQSHFTAMNGELGLIAKAENREDREDAKHD